MRTLSDFDVAGLAMEFKAAGIAASHAGRLLRAYYKGNGEADVAALSVGKAAGAWLEGHVQTRPTEPVGRHVSADGAVKLLVGLRRGGSVESVLMPGYRADRAAACVSSQIGCAMGCDFCASTRDGVERDLEAGEIVDQFLLLRRAAAAAGRRITSLVFMGMGEPLLNFDAVVAAVRRIGGQDLGALGWRQITISTVGIIPAIDRLAALDLNVHLAVSLHAPDDATRSRLVPVNRRYPVADLLAACRRFYERTGRIVTIEYCLLSGQNDSDDQAQLLAERVAGLRAHVNVIPYNATGPGLSGVVYQRPSQDRVIAFLTILRERGIVAHSRETRGDDVNAACGQLRRSLAVVAPR